MLTTYCAPPGPSPMYEMSSNASCAIVERIVGTDAADETGEPPLPSPAVAARTLSRAATSVASSALTALERSSRSVDSYGRDAASMTVSTPPASASILSATISAHTRWRKRRLNSCAAAMRGRRGGV
eukprot:366387-Chlamydomonas_euryale.AAC.12